MEFRNQQTFENVTVFVKQIPIYRKIGVPHGMPVFLSHEDFDYTQERYEHLKLKFQNHLKQVRDRLAKDERES